MATTEPWVFPKVKQHLASHPAQNYRVSSHEGNGGSEVMLLSSSSAKSGGLNCSIWFLATYQTLLQLKNKAKCCGMVKCWLGRALAFFLLRSIAQEHLQSKVKTVDSHSQKGTIPTALKQAAEIPFSLAEPECPLLMTLRKDWSKTARCMLRRSLYTDTASGQIQP